ncbi:hypothetical protein Tco_0065216 [Tanacetum coccineum]
MVKHTPKSSLGILYIAAGIYGILGVTWSRDHVNTLAGNAPNENLLKEDVSIVPVSVKLHGVPVTDFSEDGLSAIATKPATPLMLDSYTSNMCMQCWGRSRYTRVMIELSADVELKDNIFVAMPRVKGKGHYICADEKKNVKKPNQPSRGVTVGPTMCFKPQKEYRPVKKPAANNEGNKNNNVQSTNEANSSRCSFWNAEFSSPSTTPTMEKINKIENLIMDGKAILVDNERKPLRKVNEDSEDEVASVDNDMTYFLSKNDGYGNLSLLELWKDSYELDNYEYDPYDDDLYEGEEFPETLQAFCDRLDIKVRGRKKK